MTVTGTIYKSTRPRGLAPWRPQKATRTLVAGVEAVLDEYSEHLPLTARQVFYRLVGTGLIGKTESDYSRLCEALNRSRRAGLIPWDALRDDGTRSAEIVAYDDVDAFEFTVRRAIDTFRLPFHSGVEVWVEADGMVPMVATLAHQFRVPVYSSGGFDSVTAKHRAARRALASPAGITVLHVGDLDPSGCALVDSAADDVCAFVADYGKPGFVRFERIAVLPEHVEAYGLPTAPPKATDRRGDGMAETVQVEALAPTDLLDIVRDALRRTVDLEALAAHRLVEQEQRELLRIRFGGDS